MYGHDSQPSRIYSFGAKAPEGGLPVVVEQMRIANRYRNALVELELARRARVDQMLRELSPDLLDTEARIAAAEKILEDLRQKLKARAAEKRKRESSTEEREAIREVLASLKALRARRKELRKGLFESSAWETTQEAINEWAGTEAKRLRKESGLYWGTYLHVEQSMSGVRRGAPPRFRGWRGDGHLAVQLQGGLPVRDLLTQVPDSRFRIAPVPEEAWLPGGRKLRRTMAYLRVQSDEQGNPIWADVPIVLHRPLPEDATIKWVHLVRRRIGCSEEWRVQLVLARARGWDPTDRSAHGEVGIDVGWRLRPDGGLRVAYWVGSDGAEGELCLPPKWLAKMRKVEDLRAIRDKNFNAARDALTIAMAGATEPEWLVEAGKTILRWRAPRRLAALVLRLRDAYASGEKIPVSGMAIVEAEGWRKQDRHLYQWEAHLREKLFRQREDLYRNFAATLRRRYHLARVEKLDLRDFHELPEVEEGSPDGALREHVRDAALSVLFRTLKESMAEIVEVDPKDTTRKHCDCGSMQDWDRRNLMHTCTQCGRTYDQDVSAARNLLASAGVAGPGGESDRGPEVS